MEKQIQELLKELGFFDDELKKSKGPQATVQRYEKVIGKMNEFEKSCYAVLEIAEKKHKDSHNEFGPSLDDIPDHLKDEHIKMHTAIQLANTLLSISLQKRFKLHFNEIDSCAFRKGFKITRINMDLIHPALMKMIMNPI